MHVTRFRPQRIRDPLHDLIEFDASEFENALWGVIQTRPFQRLRRIKQLGFSELVYPGATHSRFVHSVGVFHVARRLMKIVERHLGTEYRPSRGERGLAAALVHDLGHGPFSHAFEDVGKRLGLKLASRHEDVTDEIVKAGEVADALNELGSGFADDVANVVKSGPVDIYSAVVSSQFDADRLDYMQRDRLMTGTQHADIDFIWLLANLEVDSIERGVDEQAVSKVDTFVLGPKAVYAAEAYVLGLFQLYPTVYFHKATRSAEKLFSELLLRFVQLVQDGSSPRTGLGKSHPLTRFAREPDDLETILALDDASVWGALSILSESKDDALREMATRLKDRKLLKAIDVRDSVGQRMLASGIKAGDTADAADAVDRACAYVGERVNSIKKRKSDAVPRILWDEAEREPYKQLDESKGPLNQIRIKTAEGSVDLRERSAVVKSIETYRLNRAYVRKEDDESTGLLETLIGDGIEHAKR